MSLDRSVARIAIVITVIEVVVLVRWLGLTSTAAAAVAAGFLYAGILVEEVLRFRLIKGRLPQGRDLTLIAAGVAVETIGWILPVALQTPIGLTFGILFVALTSEHAIIGLATTGFFDVRSVLDFSALETAGGALWLTEPSAATIGVLTVTSFLEHVQGVRQGLGLR